MNLRMFASSMETESRSTGLARCDTRAGMRAADLKRAREIIKANETIFQEKWDAHFHA